MKQQLEQQVNSLVIEAMEIYDPIKQVYPIEEKAYKQYQKMFDETDELVKKIEHISDRLLTEAQPPDTDIQRLLIIIDCAMGAINKLETAKNLDNNMAYTQKKSPLVEEQEEVRNDN